MEYSTEQETMFHKALDLCFSMYRGKKDKNGDPYFLHPYRVASRVEDINEKICACLHDIVEDNLVTLEELYLAGFDNTIVETVDCLTRKENETYKNYIGRVLLNKIARNVKKEDLKDNIDLTRICIVTVEDVKRTEKYLKALKRIIEKEGEEI